MISNHQITDVLQLTAKLQDLHGSDSNQDKYLNTIAFQIDRLTEQIGQWTDEQLKTVVNTRSIPLIREIIETGTCSTLTNLLSITPLGVLELLKIKGCGPKKVATIWKEMGITEPAELMYACNENRLIEYKGFGSKAQQSILEATEFYLNSKGKYLPPQVNFLAKQLEKYFVKQLKWKASIVGDIARQMEIIENVEILVAQELNAIVSQLDAKYFSDVKQIDTTKVEAFAYGIKIFLLSCAPKDYGSTLLKKNSSTIFFNDFDDNYKIIGNSEEEIFANNALPFIPAFLRESSVKDSMQLLQGGIISESDIKGVIHNHSTYSDGAHSLLQMSEACIELGYQYLVISDHSQYASYANGLTAERIAQQHAEIDALNIQLAPFKIFKSIECDILPDGSLDYSPSVLNTFDIVIASVHSVLQMSEERAMERLLLAIQNPFTSILGHPTGRLLLGRSGYPLRMEEIIEACAKHNVVIELNANPRRLDIDWRWIGKAVENKVLISINPDAHSTEGIKDIKYGVAIAQKAGLQAKYNLSSYSLTEMNQFVLQQKSKR